MIIIKWFAFSGHNSSSPEGALLNVVLIPGWPTNTPADSAFAAARVTAQDEGIKWMCKSGHLFLRWKILFDDGLLRLLWQGFICALQWMDDVMMVTGVGWYFIVIVAAHNPNMIIIPNGVPGIWPHFCLWSDPGKSTPIESPASFLPQSNDFPSWIRFRSCYGPLYC